MKKAAALLALALVVVNSTAFSADDHAKKHPPAKDQPATPTEAALIAKARETYPLKTCLVSDEPLGNMGEAAAYVHREAGKPDRVVFFCCEGCADDFKQDPAKFLKKVDAAAKNKAGDRKS